MIFFCLISVLVIPGQCLLYSRNFPPNDEDSYEYEWRVRREQAARENRNHMSENLPAMYGPNAGSLFMKTPLGPPSYSAELEEYLRQMLLSGELRREPPVRGRLHRPWSHALPEQPPPAPALPQSDFAVPPSDIRFFHPRPSSLPQQVFYRDEDTLDDKKEEVTEEILTTEKREETKQTTTEESNPDEVVKTPLVEFSSTQENIILVALITGSSVAAVVGVALLIYGFLKLQKKAKDAADVEYPAYGVTGPNKEATPTGDRRLAHSAQMYHYQLTKQTIIAMDSSNRGERRGSVSEADSEDDENEEGDYTVYECPGLAPTGEMEVKNPLFQDETTPANNDQNKE
ncbi:unnamed protein product [Nezara viridula]|uniref:Neural proliferation differentiation and control protein 1 n=1 Tax=Nezara viridula TaxID=85310 RepID=A0A9P0E0L8_NEZVI|nr:unnamed protein product [Nezara viridula]